MDGVIFNDLHNEAGTEMTVITAGDRYHTLDTNLWRSTRWLKIRSGTSSTPVTQLANRNIRLWLRQVQ